MIDGYDDNFSTTDRPIYVKPASMNPPNIYIKGKWLDENKDRYTNVFIDDKPLIRCKDCKYWKPPEEYKGHIYLGTCARDKQAYLEDCAIQMDADDFCSRGERKDDNKDKH